MHWLYGSYYGRSCYLTADKCYLTSNEFAFGCNLYYFGQAMQKQFENELLLHVFIHLQYLARDLANSKVLLLVTYKPTWKYPMWY